MPLRDVLSQDHAVQILKRSWSRGMLHHGWLLTGPSGVGKSLLAQEMGHLLVCESPTDEIDSCGTCRSCHLAASEGHPDLIWITLAEGKTRISVDQVRELRARLEYPPHGSRARAVIFEGAEQMTTEAQNALLKTLEEPTPRTHIFLTTNAQSRLLPTVPSRCSRLELRPLPGATLKQIIGNLRPELDQVSLTLASNLSSGSVTTALKLTEMGLEELTNTLESIDSSLAQGDVRALIRLAEEISKDRSKMVTALELLALWYRDVMYVAADEEADQELLAFPHRLGEIRSRAESLGVDTSGKRIAVALEAIDALNRFNANARLTAESTLLRMYG